ncbi:MAG: acyltransferase family protein [Solobacterium sp.]|nr:acyltransferase family protein [Solobacterium sp.]
MKTKYYQEIDALYTIGIVLVIFGHSHPSDWSLFAGSGFEKAILFVYAFHMPLFFFAAGFLLRNSASLPLLSKAEWLKGKALKLLLPYAVLSLAGLLPKYLAENGSLAGLSLQKVLFFLLVPRQNVWGHFWFMPVLFAMDLLFVLLPKTSASVYLLAGICGGLYFLPLRPLTFAADISTNLVFFAAGMAVKELGLIEWLREHMGFCRCFAPAGMAAGWLLFRYLHAGRAAMLVCAFAMIGACLCVSVLLGPSALTKAVSRFSMTFYLYGWMFQAVTMFVCGRLHLHWPFVSVLMFAAGVLGPAGLILFCRKAGLRHPLLDLLTGMK